MARFTLRGQDAMASKLRALAAQFDQQLDRALREEAEQIMRRSKEEFVPVNLGALRGSGKVGNVRRKGKELEVNLTFGDASAPYALAVHEHPSKHSPPSWRGKPIEGIHSVRTGEPWSLDGRGPKYLERPLNEATAGMAKRLAGRLEL